jgi:putative CocE/NonD family hydrolase
VRGLLAAGLILCAIVIAALPAARVFSAPPAAEAAVRERLGVRIPMRDGVELAADVWLPEGDGPHPVLLERTPYTGARGQSAKVGQSWAQRGYVFVSQDARGRGDSGGQFRFLADDGHDGYDAVEWLARQDWSNGRIAMIGGSYPAVMAWLAAREVPPHLVCMIPRAAPGRFFDELPYQGGAFLLEWSAGWIPRMSRAPAASGAAASLVSPPPPPYGHRPLLTMDEAMGQRMPIWREFLTHSTEDEYWKRLLFTPEDFRKIAIPTLNLTGWFDQTQPGALSYWEGMRRYSPARDQQYLVIGPWTHGFTMRGGNPITAAGRNRGTVRNGVTVQGDMELSADTMIDDAALTSAFLARFLTGKASTFEQPRARVYVTGSNTWRDYADYPPAEAEPRRLYLHSAGKANSASGDGRLDWTAPAREPADGFTYDPAHPVPSDEANLGKDQQAVEERPDVLVYSSAVLEQPVEILGRVIVELHATSDARDTDFTAKLVDVHPDGRAIKLGPKATGVIRARYRGGYDRERLLTPNEGARYRIELFDMGHTFLPKHRIRLEISSSAYPAVAPNPNTGLPIATDTSSRVARQRIHHDGDAPSHVVLPVVGPSSAGAR